MTDTFQQAGGCLTDRGLEALRRVSGVPPEVMGHLATCASCQRRALAVDAPRGASTKARPPDIKRTLFYVGAILAAALLAFYSMITYH